MFLILLSMLSLHTVSDLTPAIEARRGGHYVKALEEISQFHQKERTPYEKGWALLEEGLNLELLGLYESALSKFEEAFTLSHADPLKILRPSLLYEKSKSLDALGKIAEAIDTIKESILGAKEASYPNFDGDFKILQMTIRLGGYHLHNGETEQAQTILEKNLVRLNNMHTLKEGELKRLIQIERVINRQKLAELYLSLGDKTSAGVHAQEALSMAEELWPNYPHPDTLKAKQLLEKSQISN